MVSPCTAKAIKTWNPNNTYQTNRKDNGKHKVAATNGLETGLSQRHAGSQKKPNRHKVGWNTDNKDNGTGKTEIEINIVLAERIVIVPSHTTIGRYNVPVGHGKIFHRPWSDAKGGGFVPACKNGALIAILHLIKVTTPRGTGRKGSSSACSQKPKDLL